MTAIELFFGILVVLIGLLSGIRFRTCYRTVKSRKRARIALDPAACQRIVPTDNSGTTTVR